MRCNRERVSWLDDKIQGWFDSNGPLCPSAERSTLQSQRKSALLMLAGAAACLATFIPQEIRRSAPVAQPALEAQAAPELLAKESMAALKP